MIRKMSATDWRSVLATDGRDFGSGPGRQTYALRRRADVQNTINFARRAIQRYEVGFPEYLSYIISELLYNATEHGKVQADIDHPTLDVAFWDYDRNVSPCEWQCQNRECQRHLLLSSNRYSEG
jgi:hypothetical protein